MIRKVRLVTADKLVRTGGLLFIALFLSSLFNYAFQVAMGRLLRPSDYGLLNALLSIFMVLGVPVATLLMVISKKTAEYNARQDFSGIKSLFKLANFRILAVGFVGLAIFVLFAATLRDFLHAPSVVPILILGMAIFTSLIYPINVAVLQGLQNYKWLAISMGFGGPFKFLFCVLLVMWGFGISGAVMGFILTNAVLWIVSYIPLQRYFAQAKTKLPRIKHISLAQIWPVFLANLAFSVMTQLDMVLVSRYFSAHDAGMYASAAILGKAIMYLPGSIVLAMFPMVSEHKALDMDSRHLLQKAVLLTVILSGSGAILMYSFPHLIISLFFGDKYLAAAPLLKYFGLAMLPMAILMVLMQYLIAHGRSFIAYMMIVAAGFEIVAISLFHPTALHVIWVVMLVGLSLITIIPFIVLILGSRKSVPLVS